MTTQAQTTNRTRRNARYYVVGKTLWQGDRFTPFAGAFATRAEAQAVADKYTRTSTDSKSVFLTDVYTASDLRKAGFDEEAIYHHIENFVRAREAYESNK